MYNVIKIKLEYFHYGSADSERLDNYRIIIGRYKMKSSYKIRLLPTAV
jgi:hypothetical protein